MGIRIWLDDVRPMPNQFDVWAKNAFFCIGLILAGNVDYISFDHDLGIGENESDLSENNTGYFVAKQIEKWAADKFISPIAWDVHSANPVGRKNIEMAMKSAERFWNE